MVVGRNEAERHRVVRSPAPVGGSKTHLSRIHNEKARTHPRVIRRRAGAPTTAAYPRKSKLSMTSTTNRARCFSGSNSSTDGGKKVRFDGRLCGSCSPAARASSAANHAHDSIPAQACALRLPDIAAEILRLLRADTCMHTISLIQTPKALYCGVEDLRQADDFDGRGSNANRTFAKRATPPSALAPPDSAAVVSGPRSMPSQPGNFSPHKTGAAISASLKSWTEPMAARDAILLRRGNYQVTAK
jgi:hypothetical protein